MITREKFFGGGKYLSFGTDVQISFGHGRAQTLVPTAPGLAAILPDARSIPGTGGPVFLLFNTGAHSVDIEDQDGGIVGTIAPGYTSPVLLSNNGFAAGVWHMKSTEFIPSSTSTPTPTPTTSGSASVSASASTSGTAGTTGGTTAGSSGNTEQQSPFTLHSQTGLDNPV